MFTIYGEKALDFKPGDIFIPVFDEAFVTTKVTLKKINDFKVLLEMYDAGKIGLDSIIKTIREIVEPKIE